MVIMVQGTRVTLDDNVIAFQEDNKVQTIKTTIVDAPTGSYSYKMDMIYSNGVTNIIDLGISSSGVGSIDVTADIVPFNGKCKAQIRRIGADDETVMHTQIFEFWIKNSLHVTDTYDPVPSEFLEFETRFQELANHPPKPNSGGIYWDLWNINTHQYEISTIPLPSATSGVQSVNSMSGVVVLTKDHLGLSQVGNFKAVSTVAGQGLTDTEKQNARDNIGVSSGGTYTHEQTTASTTWNIAHNLGRYPSITVVDSTGTMVMGEYQYIDDDNITCTFSASIAGKAYLN